MSTIKLTFRNNLQPTIQKSGRSLEWSTLSQEAHLAILALRQGTETVVTLSWQASTKTVEISSANLETAKVNRVWEALHSINELTEQFGAYNSAPKTAFLNSLPRVRKAAYRIGESQAIDSLPHVQSQQWSFWRELSYQVVAIWNIFKRIFGKNYSIIGDPLPGQSKLLLGPMPNHVGNSVAYLKREGEFLAVLTCQDDMEVRQHKPFAQPYTQEELGQENVTYKRINIADHTFMTPEKMNEAADFIEAQLKSGRNVYVHCRAGQGRSAIAIAAYLIKYRDMTLVEAINCIEQSRPHSTVRNKIPSLEAFIMHLEDLGYLQAPHNGVSQRASLNNDDSLNCEKDKAMKLLKKQAIQGIESARLLLQMLQPE